jgi:hypothetical protein
MSNTGVGYSITCTMAAYNNTNHSISINNQSFYKSRSIAWTGCYIKNAYNDDYYTYTGNVSYGPTFRNPIILEPNGVAFNCFGMRFENSGTDNAPDSLVIAHAIGIESNFDGSENITTLDSHVEITPKG